MASDPQPAPAVDPEFPNLDPAVVAGYRGAPEHRVAEILDGELQVLPRPRLRHARASSKLGATLDGPFDAGRDGPGGWGILDEPELRLGRGPDVVVPDLAGWHRGRLPEHFFDSDDAFTTLAPDWVCEVLSPPTEAVDRTRKRRIYRREGVGHLWMLDPTLRTLEVYRLENGRWTELDSYEGDAVVRAEPFEAVEISIAALWAA